VAPLKRLAIRVSPRLPLVFHGRKAVAPLKLGRP